MTSRPKTTSPPWPSSPTSKKSSYSNPTSPNLKNNSSSKKPKFNAKINLSSNTQPKSMNSTSPYNKPKLKNYPSVGSYWPPNNASKLKSKATSNIKKCYKNSNKKTKKLKDWLTTLSNRSKPLSKTKSSKAKKLSNSKMSSPSTKWKKNNLLPKTLLKTISLLPLKMISRNTYHP